LRKHRKDKEMAKPRKNCLLREHVQSCTYIIKDVVSQEADCPYCNNRMLLPGVNSFAERHEDLLSEWDYKNNYLLQQPTEVLDTSHDTAWWICPKDITPLSDVDSTKN